MTLQLMLQQALQQLSLSLSEQQQSKLLQYIQWLKKWNRIYNLTAITDERQMMTHHLFDSLAILPSLQSQLPSGALRAIDVGSGAGLPGVVLAIVCPDWDIVCVDAVEKKTAFITQVAGALGLSNLSAHHGRIQSYQTPAVDFVISRAFASLVDFADWSGFHVKQKGHLIAMKGKFFDDEVAQMEANTPFQLIKYELINVPFLEASRSLFYCQHREV